MSGFVRLGVVGGWVRCVRVVVLVVVVGLLGCVWVGSALAAEPWWQLGSSGVPTHLFSGVGRDEVQEVVVHAEGGEFLLIEAGAREESTEFIQFDVSAGKLQEKLEGLYGKGNVLVSGKSVSVLEEAEHFRRYVVTFSGALARTPVGVMSAASGRLELNGEEGEGKATVSEVTKGASDGEIVMTAINLGDLPVTGAGGSPVVMSDVLPAGVVATGVRYTVAGLSSSDNGGGDRGSLACTPTAPATAFPAGGVSCSWSEAALYPFELLEVVIEVNVAAGAVSGGENEVKIAGGEGLEGGVGDGRVVASGVLRRPVTIAAGATPFGIENYTLSPENEGGSLDTQAGSHPFQLTTTLAFNETAKRLKPPAFPKDLHFQWPAGLIGNPTVVPQCTEQEFSKSLPGNSNECPADTVIGVASVSILITGHGNYQAEIPTVTEVPVFNLVPERGEPARVAFEAEKVVVTIDPSIRTGRDYGVTVSVDNLTELAAQISSRVTVWGVPGAAIHDPSRGWSCVENGEGNAGAVVREAGLPPCTPLGDPEPAPFLTLPTSCPTNPVSGAPERLQSPLEVDSWQEPNNVLTYALSEPLPALSGCGRLPFAASLEEVEPEKHSASSPSGLAVKIHVPQESSLDGEGLAVSDVRDTTVTLPEGITTNAAGANGLQACSTGLVGYEAGGRGTNGELGFSEKLPVPLEAGINFCPDASKIGTVKITTPVLAHPLEGAVYLASQNANPFGSLVATYIVAEDPVSGVLLKLAGEDKLNQETGQIVSTFENTPQAPFENLELRFFGGQTAPLATPTHCGTYKTNASFTPWSGNAPVDSSASFAITSGPGGGACPGEGLAFAPSFTGGSTNLQASAFTDMNTVIGREDGNQNLQAIQLHFPPGVTGLLTGVALCREPQADEGTCGQESKIGETTASVGVGADPYTVTGGEVFITGPYNGQSECTVGTPGCAPFGLSIVTPAVAGPYNLGKVIVRAKIEINPTTAALTVTTNPSGAYAIPHILDGIPLEIKHVQVSINRPGFTINPTNCTPMAITGAISSAENTTTPLTVPFQVADCANLAFAPKFTATTSAHTTKEDGASLTTTVAYPTAPQGTQANIAKVKVDLPYQLPSRLTTLQKACLAAVFETNPASCPADSIVGHATVHTPLLPVPLTGPAYFVSHGNEAFPSLTMLLQGYGVTIELVGSTFIHNGITSTTFKQTPDSPFNTFELTLPQGPYSALTANGNLCDATLNMPTAFVAQNGTEIHQNTPINVEGCPNTITITKHTLKKHTLTLTITVPTAGQLTATGKHITKTTKTTKGRETLKLTLHTTNTKTTKTTIKLTLTTTKHTKLTTKLTTKL
jgi:hypothetical protein